MRRGGRVTGAVFMGMGEPFLNYDRVMAAAELLRCPFGGAIGARAITISTVGLVPEIDRFTAEKRRFRLSISLGAATDEKRAQLVPSPAGRRSPRSWPPPAAMPWTGAIGSCWRTSASRGSMCPRTTPARWAT